MSSLKPRIMYIHGAEPLVGVGRRFKELHKRLCDEFDITLLSLAGSSLNKESFDEGIVTKYCFPSLGKLLGIQSSWCYYQYRFLHYLLSPVMVRKILRRADIIHEEMSPLPFLMPLYVKKPIVLTVNEIRGTLNFNCFGVLGGVPYILEKLLRHVPYDAVISVSRVTHERLNKLGIRNILIPNGVDTNKFMPPSCSSWTSVLSILSVMRLVEHKGCGDFLKIAERVCKRRKDVRFFLVGKGPLESEMKMSVKKMGLENRIAILKNLPEDEYIRVVQSCDIYLHTNSNQEGFGFTVAEAMSCAKPVVSYDIPGVNELIVNRENGILVKPGNIGLMAEALLELLGNKEKRKNLGESARLMVLCKCDWHKSEEKLRQIYSRLLG